MTIVSEQSTAELIQHATEQISRLVRDEFRLAQAELRQKGRSAGVGAGMLGGSGVMAFYGGATLVATAILALAIVLPDWLAALIVGAALLLIAGVLALVGRSRVRRAVPPVPQEAIHGIRDDLDLVTGAVRERGGPR